MSTTYYTVHQHIISVPRVRDRSNGNAGTLSLAVKQYTPKARSDGAGLTLIAAQANACPKELYEPLWDRFHEVATRKGITISNIWMADIAHQGESGVLNEGKRSDEDFSLTNHSRDLLTLINHFKEDMRHPIIGLGHSMGGIDIAHLSLMYPRLFTGIILIDPMIQQSQSVKATLTVVKATAARKDRWASREEARRYLGRAKVYRSWEAKAFDKFIEHGLRPVSKEDGKPSVGDAEVELTTPPRQEVLSMVRPGFTDANGIPDATMLRPEPRIVFDMLKHVRPSVQFLVGEESHLWQDPAEKVASSGLGTGGSGSKAKLTILEGLGHYAPMESPTKVAEAIVRWIDREIKESATSWKL